MCEQFLILKFIKDLANLSSGFKTEILLSIFGISLLLATAQTCEMLFLKAYLVAYPDHEEKVLV